MIRILRYLCQRFWVVCMVCLPLSFMALPRLTAWLPGIAVSTIVAVLFILTGLILGTGMDILGKRRIQGLIREGELWERAGIQARAEKRYIRAQAVFDSAWISPWAARRSGPQLRDVLSRFYLTSGSRQPGFGIAAALNIKADPGDETLVLLWLGRLGTPARADGLTQSVLTVLADTHYAHPQIARELVPVFLSLGRVDFSAKRLYRYFSGHGHGPENDEIRAAILKLMGTVQARDGLESVQTLGEQRNGFTGSNGSNGSQRSAQAVSTSIIRPYFQQSRRVSGGIARQITSQIIRFSEVFRAGGRGFFSVLIGMKSKGIATLRAVREKEKFRLYLKWGLMGLLGIWLVVFVWNTLSHMLKTIDEPAQRIEVTISKPLTIQVAAYLKQVHADRYVTALKKKGVLATVKKTRAGGKTWYLVRISEFTDKKSAENYGNRLRAQKIIDDFFVSNK